MVFVSQPGTFFLADDRLSWFPPAVLRRRVGCSSCAANLLSKRLEGAFKPNFKRGELPNTAAVTIARPQIPGPFPNAVSRSTQNLRAPPIVPLATIPRFRRPHPIGCRTREPGNLIRINRRRRGPCDIVPARTSRRDGARLVAATAPGRNSSAVRPCPEKRRIAETGLVRGRTGPEASGCVRDHP